MATEKKDTKKKNTTKKKEQAVKTPEKPTPSVVELPEEAPAGREILSIANQAANMPPGTMMRPEIPQAPAQAPQQQMPINTQNFNLQGTGEQLAGLAGQVNPQLSELNQMQGTTTGNPMIDLGMVEANQAINAPPEGSEAIGQAEPLPPEAPLWLKLIRGALTPVPPLAAIPHMFIRDYEKKRAAVQEQDKATLKSFFDLYQKNPLNAAQLAKSPVFRDPLMRAGLDADDIQGINEAAQAQPFSAAQMALLVLNKAVDVAPGTKNSIKVGDRTFKIPKPPVAVGSNQVLYDAEEGTPLFNAAWDTLEKFHSAYQEKYPKATMFDSILAYKTVRGSGDAIGKATSKGKILLWDKSAPFEKIKSGEAVTEFNATEANKHGAKVTVVKDREGIFGKVLGVLVTDVDNPYLNAQGETEYPHQWLPIQELVGDELAAELSPDMNPDDMDAVVDSWWDKFSKSFWEGYTGEDDGRNTKLNSEVKMAIIEHYLNGMAAGQVPPMTGDVNDVDAWIGNVIGE